MSSMTSSYAMKTSFALMPVCSFDPALISDAVTRRRCSVQCTVRGHRPKNDKKCTAM